MTFTHQWQQLLEAVALPDLADDETQVPEAEETRMAMGQVAISGEWCFGSWWLNG